MTTITEADVEQAALAWLSGLGWGVAHGPDIAPDATSAEESEMTFSFDGRVLSIEICGRVYEVLATGDSWPSSYRVVVSRESKLPARFMSSSVEVIVLGGHLRMDGLPLGPCEAIV